MNTTKREWDAWKHKVSQYRAERMGKNVWGDDDVVRFLCGLRQVWDSKNQCLETITAAQYLGSGDSRTPATSAEHKGRDPVTSCSGGKS
jgi:hypothetical protein